MAGLLTSFPGSLGLPGPSNIFNNTGNLPTLLREAKDNLDHFAHLFANGNPQLEKGIRGQHEIVLRSYADDMALPLENSLCAYCNSLVMWSLPILVMGFSSRLRRDGDQPSTTELYNNNECFIRTIVSRTHTHHVIG